VPHSAAAASSLSSVSPATSIALATTPACARTFCSMALAICGLSRRKDFAFSRPWPIRWPSALNQAPDFSTIVALTPRSISSPSFEMPFAGHPTLGTAHVVRELFAAGDALSLEMRAGIIPVKATGDRWQLKQLGDVAPILEAGGVFPYAKKVGMLKV
jgi:hypothetical protein